MLEENTELDKRIQEIEHPPPVLTKLDFVERFRKGEFGNALKTWGSLSELRKGLAEGISGKLHFRNKTAGAFGIYDVLVDSCVLGEAIKKVRIAGFDPESDFYFSLMAPTEHTLFQGEVFESRDRGLALYYSTIPKPMRDSLKEGGIQCYGLEAIMLIRRYLCPASQDWLNILLERYPEHVVEFSAYGVECGKLKGFNTLFWEVRKY